VAVDVNLNVHHVLGDVTTLERKKFITIHADQTTRDWFENDNLRPDVADHFLNGYDVYMGRNTGAVQWTMNSQVDQDPSRLGFADTTHLASLGTTRRNNYANQTAWHPFEARTENVLCTQIHPFYPNGQLTNKGWAFSQADTENEPFGTASGEFYAHYIKHFFGNGGASGDPLPKFIEITNEPLWDLPDEIDNVFKFHKTVAREVRKKHADAVIAGYCTAFPNLEENNFQRWETRWKRFMDEVGDDMDLWSIHLYDFPSISNGQKRLRRGSNVEATLDMMEHYSTLKFGEVKPFLITEFGASSHDYRGAWSAYRDYLHNTAANALAMQFMERSNNIAQALNYTMLKAKWGSPSVDNTWQARLLRMQGEPSSFSGSWVYSDRVHFYELWANVRGKRTDVKAAHLDIMSDAYVDGDKAYVVLNNLAWEPKELKLNLFGLTNVSADELMVKHYHLADDNAVFDRNPGVIDTTYFTSGNIPNTFTIDAEATMILEYSLSEMMEQPITAN
ncbi:MAG: agarase, partial [Bacteroidota bacterium]